jgi:Zn-dependent protease with chaperone function
MTDAVDYYPPAPVDVPPDLTAATPGYRARVVVVLTSLILFVLVYVGLVVGSAYLCYYAFVGPSSADQHAAVTVSGLFREVDQVQERAIRLYNNAARGLTVGGVPDSRFLQTMERDVLPPWRAQRQRLAQVKGLPAEEQRLVGQTERYFQLQEESWETLCRAVTLRDNQLAEQARQKGREADELARKISASASRYSARAQPAKNENPVLLWIVGIVSGLLCLFLVKGLFKWRRSDPGLRLEITEKDQPVLFAFIRQVCRDTGAPSPHRVYLTPDVNAAVFYHESFLSLFLPTPKNLIIGLGLVNRLNLSEFKAVLAHEFGHFSQNSMKLGTYVYRSNRIIGDLVFGRDWLDDIVGWLRRVDIRIAIFAWAFTGILWLLRMGLRGLFRLINFANAALSRQMEFNADLVAVSVAGSDALVHGLVRLDLASDALSLAWHDLRGAADHKLYTRDLFYHQTRAAEYLRAQGKDPNRGEPPALPADQREAVQVFRPEDTSAPRMWATHPCNHDREVNAKRRYVRSPIDERSPWLLFQDAPAVREEITHRIYKENLELEGAELQPPEVVQAFIDEEHAETTYHPRYQGLYDQRYLTPGDLADLVQLHMADLATAGQLSAAHVALHGDELKARMEGHQARQQEYGLLAPIANGAVELTGKDFAFRGGRHPAGDAKRLLEQIQKELDEDYAWMGELDRQSFLVHHEMARQVGDAAREELEERYRFHLAVQGIHSQLIGQRRVVHATLDQLSGRREVPQAEFQGVLATLGRARETLREELQAAGGLRLPALKNVTPGAPLGPLLLTQPLIHQLNTGQNSLDGQWIGRLLGQMSEVIDRAQRIHFKSLGGLLALQEGIAQRWAALQASPGPE